MLRIKEVLKERRLTIKWLAEQMDVSPAYVSAVIRNESVSLKQLGAMAKIIKVPVCSLIADYTEQPVCPWVSPNQKFNYNNGKQKLVRV